jgi:hypothetical protein
VHCKCKLITPFHTAGKLSKDEVLEDMKSDDIGVRLEAMKALDKLMATQLGNSKDHSAEDTKRRSEAKQDGDGDDDVDLLTQRSHVSQKSRKEEV